MNNHNEYGIFTTKALVKAVELMVSRQDLKNREIAEALLGAFGFSQQEIIDQLQRNEFVDGVKRSRLNLVRIS